MRFNSLTGFLCVVTPASVLQIVIAVCLMLFFIRQYSYYSPYVDESISSLKTFTQWQIYVVYFVALLLRTNAFSAYRYDVFLSVVLVLAVIANLLLEVYQHVSVYYHSTISASLSKAELDNSNASNPLHNPAEVGQTKSFGSLGSPTDDEDSLKEYGICMSLMTQHSVGTSSVDLKDQVV